MKKELAKLNFALENLANNSTARLEKFVDATMKDLARTYMCDVPKGLRSRLMATCRDALKAAPVIAIRDAGLEKINEMSRTLNFIEHDISLVLRVETPDYTKEVAELIGLDEDEVKALDDNAFVSLLAKGRKIGDEAKRLSFYLKIVRLCTSAIDKAKDRIAKLSKRTASDTGQEGQVASLLKSKMDTIVKVLWKRRETAARMFFAQRRKTLSRLVNATALFDLAWKAPSISLANIVKAPQSDMDTPIRLLIEMDTRHRYLPKATTKKAEEAMA